MRHLLFDVAPHSIRAALVEDGELTEFQYEDRHHESLVGNIYVGRVQDMHRGISACFVDIGTGKNGYLPLPEGDKRPIGSTVVVQVLKDAAKEKGAVLTERLSIAGRFLVLLPGQGGQIAVSQKIIKPEERERIRTLLLPLLQAASRKDILTASSTARIFCFIKYLPCCLKTIDRKIHTNIHFCILYIVFNLLSTKPCAKR